MKAFLESAQQTLQRLGTNVNTGLSEQEVTENAAKFGSNTFTKKKPTPFLVRIFHAASEPMIVMLIIAAIITLLVNTIRFVSHGEAEFIECIGIFTAIALAVAITVMMEGRSEKAFDALNKIKENIQVKVLRGGVIRLIPQHQLVVGDIAMFEIGDKIPIDGRLIFADHLMVDESSLTGESIPSGKCENAVFTDHKTPVAERTNMLYSGCYITGGTGSIVVTEVGDQTEFGAIARQLGGSEKSSTPLQERLDRLGKMITILGASMAGIVFVIELFTFMLRGTMSLENVSEAFITSIVLIVAAVPEGLPTIVAVSLSINIIKMARQNALVKKLIACETVGCINVICSDKTGTLTENRMTMTDFFTNGTLQKPPQLTEGVLTDNFCINSTANIDVSNHKTTFIGNPTECAMLMAFSKAVSDPDAYKRQREQADIVHVYRFSSETKNMTTILRRGDRYLVLSKGSPEKILAQCSSIIAEGSSSVPIGALLTSVETEITHFQNKSARVLAFAHKEMSHLPDFENCRDEIESDMVYDGFVVISDPLRSDVAKAVQQCRHAGIELKILTGDNIVTARAIADQLDILHGGAKVVSASEIEDLSQQELMDALPHIKVIARSTPAIKMRVVQALKALGNIVAVTGDGINDAPAISHADVGIAMGITGTEVSKQASDIVLLDDSFSTIVKAVQWGRGIYENFQRFIQFQLTVNLSSVLVVLTSILTGFAAPFTALQLLWINIVMDGPPALTLGLEPIRGNLMKRRPIARDANIVTRGMLLTIAINGIYISIIFMLQTFYNFLNAAPHQESAVLFTLFVLFQLMNAFNARELSFDSIFHSITKNKLMLLVFGITLLLQVLITQFGGVLYNTVPLPLSMWIKMLVVSCTVIIMSELLKLLIRKTK